MVERFQPFPAFPSTAASTRRCRARALRFEAMLNREANRNGTANGSALEPWRFGAPGRDAREIGRRGGLASGESRRLAPVRELEAGVVASRNGAAKVALLRLQAEREQDLRDRRAAADEKLRQTDEMVCGLMDEAAAERATIARLNEDAERERELYAQFRTERRELEHRVIALHAELGVSRAAAEAGEAELLDRLRVLHEAGKLEPLLVALDLFEVTEP